MKTDLKYLNSIISCFTPDNFKIFKDFYEALKCSPSKSFSIDNQEFEIREMRDIIFEIEDNFEITIDESQQLQYDKEFYEDEISELKFQIRILEDDLDILSNENEDIKKQLKEYGY